MNIQILFDHRWQLQAPNSCGDALTQFAQDTGSLTKKIQSICNREFSVEVLQHELISAPDDVAESLRVNVGSPVLQRQVLLKDGDSPLVYACSLLPESALIGDYSELSQLGSRPLGDWLFSEPALMREPMQYAIISAQRLAMQLRFEGREHDCATTNPQAHLPSHLQAEPYDHQQAILLGRKTLFIGAAKPFLVSEFFLPALVDRLE